MPDTHSVGNSLAASRGRCGLAMPDLGNILFVEDVFKTMDWGRLAGNVVWNGMLALIPIATAYALRKVLDVRPSSAKRYAAATALSVVWFVFLPNTCYLLTEWRHFLAILDSGNLFLRAFEPGNGDSSLFIKLLMGSLFYFLYSAFGMVAFAMAIRPVERAAIRRGVSVRFWGLPFFVTVSLGVYLGLILRFNSWDLATNPMHVWQAIVEIGGHPRLAGLILAFGGFLWIAYESLDIWIDGLKLRLTHGKSDA